MSLFMTKRGFEKVAEQVVDVFTADTALQYELCGARLGPLSTSFVCVSRSPPSRCSHYGLYVDEKQWVAE